jgi:hypothetical protein
MQVETTSQSILPIMIHSQTFHIITWQPAAIERALHIYHLGTLLLSNSVGVSTGNLHQYKVKNIPFYYKEFIVSQEKSTLQKKTKLFVPTQL